MTSFNASIKQLGRALERQAREAEKREKLRIKAELKATAEQEVETYNEVITALTKAHKEQIEPIDWIEILNEPLAPEPAIINTEERLATTKLNIYSPSVLDKLFGSTEKKKQQLQTGVAVARKRDEQKNAQVRVEWQAYCQEWKKTHQIAEGVLQKDTNAYSDALERFKPFANITDIAARPIIHYHRDFVEIEWFSQTEIVVPNFTLALTQTGKLSQKEMAVSKFHELYQDHICSYLIRVGREVLALLPVNYLVIHMISDMVDASTGRLAKQPILSAVLYPATLASLNFDLLDPSDAMKNFKHNMNFNKATGFRQIERIDALNI